MPRYNNIKNKKEMKGPRDCVKIATYIPVKKEVTLKQGYERFAKMDMSAIANEVFAHQMGFNVGRL